MKIIKFLGLLSFLVIIVVFSALNAGGVSVNYFTGVKELPLAVLILVAFSLGVIFTTAILGFSILSLRRQNYKLRTTIAKKADRVQ